MEETSASTSEISPGQGFPMYSVLSTRKKTEATKGGTTHGPALPTPDLAVPYAAPKPA